MRNLLSVTNKNSLVATFFLITISNSGFSQNIQKLIENDGFKVFKLGTQYKTSYGARSLYSDGSTVVTINNTIEYISDIPVHEIQLFFVDDTLAKIRVKVDSRRAMDLQNALIAAFGNPTNDDNAIQIEKLIIANEYEKKKLLEPKKNTSIRWVTPKFNLRFYDDNTFIYTVSSPRYCTLIFTLNLYDEMIKRALKSKYSASDF